MVSAVGEVIDRLTLPAREKRQLESDLLQVLAEWERARVEAQSAVLVEEAKGSWCRRNTGLPRSLIPADTMIPPPFAGIFKKRPGMHRPGIGA